MIAALVNLLIVIVVVGLLLWGILWVIEGLFRCPIPLIVKQGIGIIAGLVVLLYLLRIFGIA